MADKLPPGMKEVSNLPPGMTLVDDDTPSPKTSPPLPPPPPNSVGGGFGRTLVGAAKGFYDLVVPPKTNTEKALSLLGPGAVQAKRIGEGVVDSEKTAYHQSKQYFKDAQSIKNDPSTKALLYLRSGTTAASMLLPLLATPAVTTINEQEDQGRSKEALGTGLANIAMLAAGTKSVSKMVGKVAGKVIGGNRVFPKADTATSNYIGLKTTDLPKWDRTNPGSVEDIGKIVREKVGIKSDLPQQHEAIENTRQQYENKTGQLLAKTQNVTSSPIQPIIRKIGTDLERDLRESGVTDNQIKAVGANVDALLSKYNKPNMTPAELMDMRRAIQKQINWGSDAELNVKNQFYTTLYHDLNDAIEKSLTDPTEKAEFRANNRIQNKLIIAREAAGRKLVGQALKSHKGIVTHLARIAGGAAAGGAGGAVFGHGGIGAGMGAAAPALDALRGLNFPVGDIRATQARGAVGNAVQRGAPVIQGAGVAGASQSDNPIPMM